MLASCCQGYYFVLLILIEQKWPLVKKVLLVEDDAQLSRSVNDALRKEGLNCVPVYDGSMAERLFQMDDFQLVLLDLNLPGVNGFVLCRKFREINPGIPIIILTAFGDIDSKMEAFDLGADDYLVKPVHLRELVAKVRVFLKRGEQVSLQEEQISVGDLQVNPSKKSVMRAGQAIELTPKEYNLLEYLLRNRRRVVSKDELAINVWEESYGISHNTVEVYISFLRNKIDKGAEVKLIKTKPGFGYFIDDEL